mmetsp:Transcript_9303/g.25310  ORF Transcript_9303/g.25310 Transcript_9303/m.25310 type:complete len:85 (-) Transcript_9303:2124-2378(-)
MVWQATGPALAMRGFRPPTAQAAFQASMDQAARPVQTAGIMELATMVHLEMDSAPVMRDGVEHSATSVPPTTLDRLAPPARTAV